MSGRRKVLSVTVYVSSQLLWGCESETTVFTAIVVEQKASYCHHHALMENLIGSATLRLLFPGIILYHCKLDTGGGNKEGRKKESVQDHISEHDGSVSQALRGNYVLGRPNQNTEIIRWGKGDD